MNTFKIYLFVMFIFTENIQRNASVHTSDTVSFTLYENINSLHRILNDLFTSLKLKDTFRKTTKVRLLLTIHKSFLKLLEYNYKLSEIKTITDNISTNVKTLDGQESTLNEILQDTSLFPDNSTLKENDITEVLIERFQQFLLNINKICEYMHTMEQGELKVWVPHENDTAPMRRIYNSKSTKIDRYPFMASIHLDSEFLCAGAIIKKYFVITAASCLHKLYKNQQVESFNKLMVRVGSVFTTFDGALISIIQVFFHPEYDQNNLNNNLALLRMDNNIRTAQKIMKKINKIAFAKENMYFRNNILMLGWGAKSEENEHFKFQKLSYANIDLYDLDKCKKVYSSFYVTENNFCAGYASRGSGACLKDIGDPAIVDGVLVGVVSYGPPLCGTPDAPTVFTKISHYAQWIENTIKLDMTKPSLIKEALRIPQPRNTKYTTSGSTKFTQKSNSPLLIRPVNDYPEEMKILREILEDLTKANVSLIEEVIEESFDKEIINSLKTTTKMDLLHHPLVNKSIVPFPGVHVPNTVGEYQTVSLTTSNRFTYPWQGERVPIPDPIIYETYMAEYDFIKTATHMTPTIPTVPTRSPPLNSSMRQFPDKIDKFSQAIFDEKSSQIASNYEESLEGLSIEIATDKVYDVTHILSSRERERNVATKTDTKLFFYLNGGLKEFEEGPPHKRKKKLLKKHKTRNKKRINPAFRDHKKKSQYYDSFDYK